MAVCREVLDLLTDYVEERLDPATRLRLEAHFEDCAPCENFLNNYRHSIRLVGELGEELSIPPEMEERLRRFLKSHKQ